MPSTRFGVSSKRSSKPSDVPAPRGVRIEGVRLENLVGTLAKRGGHGAHRGAAGLVGGKSQ